MKWRSYKILCENHKSQATLYLQDIEQSIPTTEEQEAIEEKQDDETPAPTPPVVDPQLQKFFKMLSFGVPAPAVKQKMMTEGFDPSLLE